MIIPLNANSEFILAKIENEYEYDSYGIDGCIIEMELVLRSRIKKSIFNIRAWYSLRAYRTLFKVRDQKEVFCEIKKT